MQVAILSCSKFMMVNVYLVEQDITELSHEGQDQPSVLCPFLHQWGNKGTARGVKSLASLSISGLIVWNGDSTTSFTLLFICFVYLACKYTSFIMFVQNLAQLCFCLELQECCCKLITILASLLVKGFTGGTHFVSAMASAFYWLSHCN